MNDVSAPEQIKGWLECLFWFTAIVSALLFVLKQMRGPRPHPPNDLLSQTADEIARRVTHLEKENSKVWVKMESDRVESKDRMANIEGDLKAIRATTESIQGAVNLMALNLNTRKTR